MTPEYWQKVDGLLKAALEHDPSERAAFLAEKCAGDEQLHRAAESLLAAQEQAGSFLETPAVPPTVRQRAADFIRDPAAARPVPASSTLRSPEHAKFQRGMSVGRYVVLDMLGAGGMGVVYAAYDPELDRKVAIKLLRPESPEQSHDTDGKARLLREAKAMARLSHPNVIAVHDVGTIGDEVFVAMEYVEGSTLRRWLDEKPRNRREIVGAFAMAGRGLAAAHSAGLVHRDFKPDNVLVGKDGRIRVLDFGLARKGAALPGKTAAPSSSLNKPGALSVLMTKTGTFMGTPAYMSPEQLKRLEVDARSDQFSFCAALYQALYSQLPFGGDDVDSRLSAIERGQTIPVRGSSHVPIWLRDTLLRGLRASPDQRHPSMSALLEALERDPSKVRRRAMAVGSIALLVGVGAWGAYEIRSQRQQVCKGAERSLAGAWDAAQRTAVENAFLSTGKPFAADAVRGVQRIFDDYARRWVSMQTEACEATRIRGEQSEELLDLRAACLSQRMQELKALASLYASADEKLVAKAVDGAQGLSDLEACANIELLKTRVKPPTDPRVRTKVEDVRSRLSTVKAMLESGRYSDALPLAKASAGEAEQLRYAPVTAEALFQLGMAQSLGGDYRATEATLNRAVLLAESGRDDEVAVRAGNRLVWLAAMEAKYEQGELFAQHALALIDRLGGNDKLMANLLNNLGTLQKNQGRYDESLLNYQRALALQERLDDDRMLAAILNNVGIALRRQGKYSEALPYYQRALAIKERALGPAHPDLGSTLINIGVVMRADGKYDQAISYFQKSLEIRERALGPTHPQLSSNLHNIADVLRLQSKYEASISVFERTVRISEKANGPDHPEVAYALTGLGQSYLGAGKVERAIETLERAVVIQEARKGEPSFLGEARFGLARALTTAKREPRRARVLAEKAKEAFIAAGDAYKKEASEVEQWLSANR